jgi:hypothetical protein
MTDEKLVQNGADEEPHDKKNDAGPALGGQPNRPRRPKPIEAKNKNPFFMLSAKSPLRRPCQQTVMAHYNESALIFILPSP